MFFPAFLRYNCLCLARIGQILEHSLFPSGSQVSEAVLLIQTTYSFHHEFGKHWDRVAKSAAEAYQLYLSDVRNRRVSLQLAEALPRTPDEGRMWIRLRPVFMNVVLAAFSRSVCPSRVLHVHRFLMEQWCLLHQHATRIASMSTTY